MNRRCKSIDFDIIKMLNKLVNLHIEFKIEDYIFSGAYELINTTQ